MGAAPPAKESDDSSDIVSLSVRVTDTWEAFPPQATTTRANTRVINTVAIRRFMFFPFLFLLD
jgi:hypothetical protein